MIGLLLIDKPAGHTSHDVVARMRKILGTRQIGHAGTLDPQATGLLVLAVNSATRWLDWLPDDKRYDATCRFGLETDTEDIWGSPIAQVGAAGLSEERAREVLLSVRTLKEQVPPMVSALKVDGVRLHQLAREGKTVDRAPRPIKVHELSLGAWSAPDLNFSVRVSAGTYVRTLCAEAGRRAITGACMAALRRTAVGPWNIEDALPEARWDKESLMAGLLGSERALIHLPERRLSAEEALKVGRGIPVLVERDEEAWRLTRPDGTLLALAQTRAQGNAWLAQPKRVFPSA